MNRLSDGSLLDVKVDVKVKLASLWAALFLYVAECVLLLLVVWYAWTWPRLPA